MFFLGNCLEILFASSLCLCDEYKYMDGNPASGNLKLETHSFSVTCTVLLLSNKVQNQFHEHQCQWHFTLKDALPYIWRSG